MALPCEIEGFSTATSSRAGVESSPDMGKALLVSGGAVAASPAPSGFGLASAWGVVSVVYIVMKGLKKLVPIALQPFSRGDFTPIHWAMYGGFSLLMAYAEGYKGFQKKFSPLVVKRALTLDARGGAGSPFERPGFLRLLLAGPYSMGLFHATKKRKTVSWVLTTGVVCLVQMVKRLPYPWRSIVDAGVVVGLTYGTLSICMIWARALMGTPPSIDPALPEPKTAS